MPTKHWTHVPGGRVAITPGPGVQAKGSSDEGGAAVDTSDQSCGPVLVADRDGQTRTRICQLLETVGLTTLQAATAEEALDQARRWHPDLVILDPDLPALSGYEVCRQLKIEFGDRVSIVFLSGDRIEPRDRVAGLVLGGDDYLAKPFDPGELLARVRRLMPPTGLTFEAPLAAAHLTAREREVLTQLARGESQAAIAAELGISPKTVANHLQNILAKLGVHSRAEAVSLAFRRGIA